MKWYRLSCPQCGWKAQQMVAEDVAKRFKEELQYCQDCKAKGKPPSAYVAQEFITSTRKGFNRGRS